MGTYPQYKVHGGTITHRLLGFGRPQLGSLHYTWAQAKIELVRRTQHDLANARAKVTQLEQVLETAHALREPYRGD